jgi:hypothetical protein
MKIAVGSSLISWEFKATITKLLKDRVVKIP